MVKCALHFIKCMSKTEFGASLSLRGCFTAVQQPTKNVIPEPAECLAKQVLQSCISVTSCAYSTMTKL